MKKEKWDEVLECRGEDGTPATWALRVSKDTEKNRFYWIERLCDGTFDVIDNDAHTVLKNCKSLSSAKRWVKMYLL